MEEKKLNNNERTQRNPLLFIVLALVCVIFAGIYYISPLAKNETDANVAPTDEPVVTEVPIVTDKPETTTVSIKELESLLSPAAELISSKYYYKNLADFDSVLTWFGSKIENPFTHSKGYIIYKGVVSVGIDIHEIKFDVNNRDRTILVHLPKEKVLSHEIDDSSVETDIKESIFNTLDASYYAKLINGCKETTENEIFADKEYMNQVRTNSEMVIRSFLTASDLTKNYKIEFDHS